MVNVPNEVFSDTPTVDLWLVFTSLGYFCLQTASDSNTPLKTPHHCWHHCPHWNHRTVYKNTQLFLHLCKYTEQTGKRCRKVIKDGGSEREERKTLLVNDNENVCRSLERKPEDRKNKDMCFSGKRSHLPPSTGCSPLPRQTDGRRDRGGRKRSGEEERKRGEIRRDTLIRCQCPTNQDAA